MAVSAAAGAAVEASAADSVAESEDVPVLEQDVAPTDVPESIGEEIPPAAE